MAKKRSIEAEMKSAQEEFKRKINDKDSNVSTRSTKKKSKTAREQYKELRESIKRKNAPNEIAFKENYEEELIKELFKGDPVITQVEENTEKPEQTKRERNGL
jgi:hypothetical protein